MFICLISLCAPSERMARRYTSSEKGKGLAEQDPKPRRVPVQIPPSDNAAPIAEKNLALIGRVTNPNIQKPWVVEWLIQYWNLETRVTGRSLGPELFQVKFENEEALLSVLRKAPYHYKRWMLLLQRWEPVNSNTFPSLIPFWITIHGLSFHHWTITSLHAIGKELGPILGEEVPKGRIRIHINGLKCLEMQLPIQLDTGEIMQVDLEYEKLEKRCFLCLFLCHEKENCPRNNQAGINSAPAQGISQKNTLRSIEERRRRNMEANKSSSCPSESRNIYSKDLPVNSHRSAHSRLGSQTRGSNQRRDIQSGSNLKEPSHRIL